MLLCSAYFSNTQHTLLLLSGVFFVLSIAAQLSKWKKFSIVFLGLTALCIFSFAALLDPFLNIWDERFHALVAKNMMNHPLMPTLFDDPVVMMDYDHWDRTHIWLHKQPLFLWQIALSFKIFGVSEFALRLPNVILATIVVLITYRSGRLLVNQRTGYVAAVLMMSTVYILELVAGRQELEHNDIAFLAYVSLSIWSLIEYCQTKKKVWIIMIGLFAGAAILCKWLVGLLVYLGWFVLRLVNKKIKFRENKDILLALLVTILVAAPWQILTMIWYPAEAANAYSYNSYHFTHAVENHGGDFWYHFGMFGVIYGTLASFLIVPAFIAFYKRCNDKKLFFALLSLVVALYLFFSAAATKMPSFTIAVAMIIFIAFASLFDYILEYFERFAKRKFIAALLFVASLLIITLLKFDAGQLREKHSLNEEGNHYSKMLVHNKEVFKSLILPENTVLFNVRGRHYIEAMFYTGLPAYNFIPTDEQYIDLKEKGRSIAIFNSGNTQIPDYMKHDPAVVIIDKEIKGYD